MRKDPFTRAAAALQRLAAASGSMDDEQLAAVLTAAGWSLARAALRSR